MGHGEKILVIGRHESMLTKVTAMLREHNYVQYYFRHSTNFWFTEIGVYGSSDCSLLC
jgi:hypothetical protein